MWSPFYLATGKVAVLPSCRLVTFRRWYIDGGFVLEIGDVVGPWEQSKLRADRHALECYRAAHDLYAFPPQATPDKDKETDR